MSENSAGPKGQDWLLNFPLGITLGAISAFGLSWLIDTKLWNSNAERYLPALIAAGATLVSATVAVAGVLRNIRNQNILAEHARFRKLTAARASLPLALSELSKLSENHIARLSNGDKQVESGSEEISTAAHETLKLVIEHANEPTQKSLSFLLMAYQVLQASYHEEKAPEPYDNPETEAAQLLAKHHRASGIISWAAFKALVAVQFQYARKGEEIDRSSIARTYFERELQNCSARGGWLLINDPLFRDRFDVAIRNTERTLLNPEYFYRN